MRIGGFTECRVVLEPGDVVRRGRCADCRFLRGHLSWWCKNAQAVAAHRTSLPVQQDCAFWEEAERETLAQQMIRLWLVPVVVGALLLAALLTMGR